MKTLEIYFAAMMVERDKTQQTIIDKARISEIYTDVWQCCLKSTIRVEDVHTKKLIFIIIEKKAPAIEHSHF